MSRTPVPPRPPHPDNWEQMGWRERAAWNMKYVIQPRCRLRNQASVDGAILKKLRGVRCFKRKKWDETKIQDWLRVMTDKQIIGFSIHTVNKLNECVLDLMTIRQFKVGKVMDYVKKEIHVEMEKVRRECVKAVKEIKSGYTTGGAHTHGDEITGKYRKYYKRIGTTAYEKDGKQYKSVSFMMPMEDYLKFKAILAIEQEHFSDWVMQRIKKYVSMKFRRLSGIHDLVDPTIDKAIPDEEMKGVDDDAFNKTENQRKEKEIALINLQAKSLEDSNPGVS